MPVIVVALLTPEPEQTEAVLDAFREVSPRVHAEPGCELYAAHTDGSVVVMVERWTTGADLDAHAAGEAVRRLNERIGDLLQRPVEVWPLQNLPMGDALLGTVQ